MNLLFVNMIFKKIKINKINFINRIIVSPMCQYSADNGCPTNWHYKHLSSFSNSGAGGLMIESTAVSKAGKITHKDLAIYNKKQIKELKKLLIFLKKINNKLPIGIQISHSGRKGSAHVPWINNGSCLKNKEKKWVTLAPSAIKRSTGWPKPKEMSLNDIKKLITDFKKAAVAADACNFDILEIHMAHGYLLHQFMSPISNHRKDKYGGSLENRCRLLIEIGKLIRKVWPKNKCLGARITGTDHLKNGLNYNDCIYLSKKLEKIGFDYICVSSGGIIPKTNMKFGMGFRMRISKKIKENTSMKVRTSGMLNKIDLINRGIKEKKIDFVAVGRLFLKNPRWIYENLNIIKYKNIIPPQYLRGY
jgi:2,4-dienoyl-CoA reductase-like NADH-dependent reductase (Old Yellow Enzyme family)